MVRPCLIAPNYGNSAEKRGLPHSRPPPAVAVNIGKYWGCGHTRHPLESRRHWIPYPLTGARGSRPRAWECPLGGGLTGQGRGRPKRTRIPVFLPRRACPPLVAGCLSAALHHTSDPERSAARLHPSLGRSRLPRFGSARGLSWERVAGSLRSRGRSPLPKNGSFGNRSSVHLVGNGRSTVTKMLCASDPFLHWSRALSGALARDLLRRVPLPVLLTTGTTTEKHCLWQCGQCFTMDKLGIMSTTRQ